MPSLAIQKSEVVRLVLTDNCQEHSFLNMVSKYFDVYITLTKDSNQGTTVTGRGDDDKGSLAHRPCYPRSESYFQESDCDIIGGHVQDQVQGQSRYARYEVRRVFARERPKMLQRFLDTRFSGHGSDKTHLNEEIIAKYVCYKDQLIVSLV
jgi:hypothetical protein